MNDELRAALDNYYEACAQAGDDFVPNPVPYTPAPSAWRNFQSDAAKVHPKQIPEAIAAAQKKGVSVDFTDKGQPLFRSRQHRKDYCEKVRGLVDMDGGIGDPKVVHEWER